MIPSPLRQRSSPSPPQPKRGLLHRLGAFAVRRRRSVLLMALLTLAVSGAFGAGAMNAMTLSRFESPGSESILTREEIAENFDAGSPNVLFLVTPTDGSINSALSTEAGRELSQHVADHPRVAEADSYWTHNRSPALRADDESQALIAAYVPGDVTDIRQNVLPELREEFEGDTGVLSVELGGSDDLFREAAERARGDFLLAELIIIPSLLLLLIVLYRRLSAALLTMGVALFTLFATLALLRVVSGFVEVSTFAANLTLVMGVGLAVDYCLFFISRYREEINAGRERTDAIARTTATAGRTVLFSGVIVAASLSVLLAFPFPFLQSFAYAGVFVPLTTAIGTLVFLPAALGVWGRHCERQPKTRSTQGFWYRTASYMMRRPVLSASLAAAVLLLLGSPFLSVNVGAPDERVLPEDSQARITQEQVTQNFSAEASDALQVLASDAQRDDVAQYSSDLSQLRGVAQVDSAVGRFIDGESVAPADERFAFVNGDTWLSVVPTTEMMRSDTDGFVQQVRSFSAPFDTAVSGYPADLSDFQDALLERLPWVLGAIVLITFIILFVMTGSVIAPLKASVLNFLSLSVMFGAVVWIFQEGHLAGVIGFTPQGAFEPSIPILMFCIAYGLSMDYEVILLARIKEEFEVSGDNERSIAVGLQRSAPLVTAAAGILAFTFAVYGTGDVVYLQMLGVGMALTVLVDATIVRGVLLPALMRLTGRWNWWAPAPLRRIHERIGVRE